MSTCANKQCASCGVLHSRRGRAIYCSDDCRQRDYRERAGQRLKDNRAVRRQDPSYVSNERSRDRARHAKRMEDPRYAADFRRRNREHKLRRIFGLGSADVDRMLASQSGRCVVCRTADPQKTLAGRGVGWCVDHDHATGIVRGVLCGNCNAGLGHLGDSSSICTNASRYLDYHRGNFEPGLSAGLVY